MTSVIQRVENGAILVGLYVAVVMLGFAWWWPLALFLLWDLSAVGYAANTRVGAWGYNLVHHYTGPVALGLVALVSPDWVMLVALSWGIHVAADRAVGYGLKHADSFQHTHLGWIGKGAARES